MVTNGARRVAAMLVAVGMLAACSTLSGFDDLNGSARTDDAGGGPTPNPDAVGARFSSKLDLLLVADVAPSMGDKLAIFSDLLPNFLHALEMGGARDVHLGVITTSLGSMGGNLCPLPSDNGRAHLVTRDLDGATVPAAAAGFLTYGARDGDTIPATDAVATLLTGAWQHANPGCALGAQLEAAYRFLVQPDPWDRIQVPDGTHAELVGMDDDLLAQRKAFLRPDSLVVVLLLTDRDDTAVDPRSARGLGWGFMSSRFPGSPPAAGATTTPRAKQICATQPQAADCASCAFPSNCNPSDPTCTPISEDLGCSNNGGFYGSELPPNLRFYHMKRQFGLDPQFPLARYVDGFTKQRVPDRDGEHPAAASDYVGDAKCTNPLFAARLPDRGEDPCLLPVGPRGKELVLFAMLGGAPAALVDPQPDWDKLVGKNPDAFDFAGQDAHMIQQTSARTGLAPSTDVRGDNGPDPTHGREWNTGDKDLQYACTFALPQARVCKTGDPTCDCAGPANPPLCGAALDEQIRAKTYPSLRGLRVVKALGDRGFAESFCRSYKGDKTIIFSALADRTVARLRKPTPDAGP